MKFWHKNIFKFFFFCAGQTIWDGGSSILETFTIMAVDTVGLNTICAFPFLDFQLYFLNSGCTVQLTVLYENPAYMETN